MGAVQGQGYIAQALGVADVLAVSYFHALSYRPEDAGMGRARSLPSIDRALRDRPLRSSDRGRHSSAGRSWKPMAATTAGCRCPAWRPTRLEWKSPAARSARASRSRWALALGLKRKASKSFVYCLLFRRRAGRGSDVGGGDVGGARKLDNLIAIVDVNNHAGRRPFEGHSSISSRSRQISKHSAGITQRVDGNDIDALVRAFDAARAHDGAGPRTIICDTLDGARACRFLGAAREATISCGSMPDEWDIAIAALDAGRHDR